MTGVTERPSNELTHGAPAGRDVVIVTFDSGQILDVTGPLEVFSSASRFLPEVRYRTRVVTTRGGSVRANCGLEFASSAIGDVVGPVDTLVVAGGSGMMSSEKTLSNNGPPRSIDAWRSSALSRESRRRSRTSSSVLPNGSVNFAEELCPSGLVVTRARKPPSSAASSRRSKFW